MVAPTNFGNRVQKTRFQVVAKAKRVNGRWWFPQIKQGLQSTSHGRVVADLGLAVGEKQQGLYVLRFLVIWVLLIWARSALELLESQRDSRPEVGNTSMFHSFDYVLGLLLVLGSHGREG